MVTYKCRNHTGSHCNMWLQREAERIAPMSLCWYPLPHCPECLGACTSLTLITSRDPTLPSSHTAMGSSRSKQPGPALQSFLKNSWGILGKLRRFHRHTSRDWVVWLWARANFPTCPNSATVPVLDHLQHMVLAWGDILAPSLWLPEARPYKLTHYCSLCW